MTPNPNHQTITPEKLFQYIGEMYVESRQAKEAAVRLAREVTRVKKENERLENLTADNAGKSDDPLPEGA